LPTNAQRKQIAFFTAKVMIPSIASNFSAGRYWNILACLRLDAEFNKIVEKYG
jgi:hypothetical protein